MYGLPDSFTGTAVKRIVRASRYTARGGSRGVAGKLTLSFKITKVTIDRPMLKLILNTPSGKLWWAFHKRGEEIVTASKRKVHVKTGKLRGSIKMTHTSFSYGQRIRISANTKYAYIHHEGTKPHIIAAKDSPKLVFMKGTRLIRTPIVNHPGTRANRYLSTPMRNHIVGKPIIVR